MNMPVFFLLYKTEKGDRKLKIKIKAKFPNIGSFVYFYLDFSSGILD
jgi:hypothetical protein